MTSEPSRENVRYVPPGWHEMNAADPARVGTLCGAMLDGLNGAIDAIDRRCPPAPAVTHVDSMMAGINALRISSRNGRRPSLGAAEPEGARALLFWRRPTRCARRFSGASCGGADEVGVEAPISLTVRRSSMTDQSPASLASRFILVHREDGRRPRWAGRARGVLGVPFTAGRDNEYFGIRGRSVQGASSLARLMR